MNSFRNHKRRAFSLIELVIVIIILGVISAIAIPRMMRGAEGADVTGLQADLAVLRGAIEMYRYEHQAFPSVATFGDQLTKITNAAGGVDAAGEFGPYLVKMPKLKTGAHEGDVAVVSAAAVPPIAAEAGAFGWQFDPTTGGIWANDTDHLDL